MGVVKAFILLWVLSDPTGSAEAWIPTTHLASTTGTATACRSTSTSTTVPFSQPGAGVQLHSSNSDGGEDDEDGCADEEECEIDWGAMPGFGDDEEEEAKQAQASPSSTNDGKQGTETTAKIRNNDRIEEQHQQEEDDDEHVPNPLGPKQVRSLRLRLEMQWQMTEAAEECDIYHPTTCGSDPCPDCQGWLFHQAAPLYPPCRCLRRRIIRCRLLLQSMITCRYHRHRIRINRISLLITLTNHPPN
jgi:hypothetical protein